MTGGDARVGVQFAEAAFLDADYDAALDALDSSSDVGAMQAPVFILRARACLRSGRISEAAANAILAIAWAEEDADRVVALTLAAHAALRAGEIDEAQQWVNASWRAEWPSQEARAEYGYIAAFVAYSRGDYDGAEASMMDAYASQDVDAMVRARNLAAHIAAARNDFRTHAALLGASLAAPGKRDAYLRAHTIMHIAKVARETALPVDVDAIMAEISILPPSKYLREWRYLTLQDLAWRYAVEGSYLRAYRLTERAMADVPSEAWLVTSHADYAQFALAAGERVTFRMHLDKALAIIERVDGLSPK